MPGCQKGGVHLVEAGGYLQRRYTSTAWAYRGHRKARKAKVDIELGLAFKIKDNKKSFFKYIGRMKKAPGNVGPLQDALGNLVVAPEEKAEPFNKFFTSAFLCRDRDSPTVFQDGLEGNASRPRVEQDQVRVLLEGLDTFKSAGPDALHPRVLRELAGVIAGPLAWFDECSWYSGQVPDDWKIANVVPVFKKGRREDPGNYRPISLTLILGKLFEKIIKEHICDGPAAGMILKGNQHGFIRGRSCQTNLIAFCNQVTKALDAGVAIDVVFLDFSKAFDTVSHTILIKKLGDCGIDAYTVRWIANWLKGPEGGDGQVIFDLGGSGQWSPPGLSPCARTVRFLYQ
ncbi:uncharacterized protein LOC109283139 [Alligator mississippiensis]|uniref:uncharacterized protein LOC109283139 n=1 Tax=Alligator mississippiensis TaxID=8496 RepID=UPI0028777978|nr:uncharacterized protein LOC109283139 [Alligator mississippiensis]XP_059581881.1 uncharacterized protein LOC109283139 [Alligator mississippiensis]XP_059581882.1 uncharacterized protein LOC109283139 [Alligator mississippiensis]